MTIKIGKGEAGKKEKTAAVLTVFDAAGMSPAGRQEIGKWMRRCGEQLVREGKNYSKRFTARYRYFSKTK